MNVFGSVGLPVQFGHDRHASSRSSSEKLKHPPSDQVNLSPKPDSPKTFSSSARRRIAWQAVRQTIQRSWAIKCFLAFGPLCLLAIPFPVLIPLCSGSLLPFFGIALYELWDNGRAAYKSPETFLKNKK